MQILLLIIGLGLGYAIGLLLAKNKSTQQSSSLQKDITALDKERSVLNAQLSESKQQVQQAKAEIESNRANVLELSTRLAQASTINKTLDEKLKLQKQEFTVEF